MLILLFIPLNTIIKLHDKETKKYNKTNTDYYIDSSGYRLDVKTIKKEVLKNGKCLKYNGYEIMFPENLNLYKELINNNKTHKGKISL